MRRCTGDLGGMRAKRTHFLGGAGSSAAVPLGAGMTRSSYSSSNVKAATGMAGDVEVGDAAASAAAAASSRFAAAFLALPPVRPMPRLSRGIKVHLQTDGRQLWQRLLDRTNRSVSAQGSAVCWVRSGERAPRRVYL